MSDDISKPAGTPGEVITRLLDTSIALLVSDRSEELDLPDDELHREILRPLLPAMLGDAALRGFWLGTGSQGFLARLAMWLRSEGARPAWEPGDFEIHVAASYSAGADARALADTLLSEEPLRELTADLMNRVLALVWEELPAQSVASQPEKVAIAEPEMVTHTREREAVESAARVLVSWRAWAHWPRWRRIAWMKRHAAGLQGAGRLRPHGWLIRLGAV